MMPKNMFSSYEDENNPIDPQILDYMAKSDPDLVSRYRQKIGMADKNIVEAQKQKEMLDYANVGGQFLNDFNNSQKKSLILKNRMEDLGSTPKVVQPNKQEYDSSILSNIGKDGVARAQQARADVMKGFENEEKIGQLSDAAALRDKGSQTSQQAVLLYQSALLSKAKEAEQAGDKEAANALRNQARNASGLSARDALAAYDLAKGVDYKDVLNNMAADKRLTRQIQADDARHQRTAEKEEKDMTFKLSSAYKSDDVTKRTTEIRQARKAAEALVANPSPANDVALVFASMRANDPKSTVREGEYQLLAQSGGLPQRFQAAYEQAKNGQLTPRARADLLKSIQTNADAQEQSQAERDQYYLDQANYYRVSPDVVLGRSTMEKVNQAQFVKMRDKNGQLYDIPANEAADAEKDGLTRVK